MFGFRRATCTGQRHPVQTDGRRPLSFRQVTDSDYEPRVDAILDSDEQDPLEDPLIASDIENCIEFMSLE